MCKRQALHRPGSHGTKSSQHSRVQAFRTIPSADRHFGRSRSCHSHLAEVRVHRQYFNLEVGHKKSSEENESIGQGHGLGLASDSGVEDLVWPKNPDLHLLLPLLGLCMCKRQGLRPKPRAWAGSNPSPGAMCGPGLSDGGSCYRHILQKFPGSNSTQLFRSA